MNYQEVMEQQYRDRTFIGGLEFDKDELCHKCPNCTGCPDRSQSPSINHRHGNKFAAKNYVGFHPDFGEVPFTDLRAFATAISSPEHRLRHALYNHGISSSGWQIRYQEDGPDFRWLNVQE